ncbi:hypothetical protein PTKIN_Ptkin13bG0139100 [Pterospermum kingtungense]
MLLKVVDHKSKGVFDKVAEKDKTLEEKAQDIFRVLKNKKFVILLDDIWERVDLSKIGIPLPTQENGSKLVFTTRSIKVCGQMKVDDKIEVQCLPEEKAWELFQENVGEETLDSNPCIRRLAREVAKECGGLPLALITIAQALAFKKTVEEWKYAVDVLKRSSISVFPDMGEEVYPVLKFSYDSLPNDMIRTCLLYCSLLSEDYVIRKDKLIDLWIGEGFLDGHENTSLARNQGHDIIGSLIRACLLEETNEFEIKMHDVIRDVFVDSMIESLVETPNCPRLQILFLNHSELKVIGNEFFQFMCGLKLLDLSYNSYLTELPVKILKLVSLEYLDLSHTSIRQLPIEFKALEKLKCLNLEYIGLLVRIPRQLITAFLNLQVLRMYHCDYSLGLEVEDNSECLGGRIGVLETFECVRLSLSQVLSPLIDF